MIESLLTLLFLILLQAVLGFDNLLYISLESKKHQRITRLWYAEWQLELLSFSELPFIYSS